MSANHLARGLRCALFAIAISALTMPHAHAAAGRTEASYGVTQNGAVSYSIPIQVTEGVAGMTPRLAIDYAGPSRRTVLGVGFALSGVSMITPCRQTVAQDLNAAAITLTSEDRYCLDGNRLRLVSGAHGATGSVYHGELDQMFQVTVLGSSVGIPTSFKAEMPDGMEYEYGVTADSKLLAGSTPGAPPQFWAVNKISDSHGNYMTFAYDTDNALRRFRPSQILYSINDSSGDAGDPHYRISFVYGVTIAPTLKYTPSLTGGAAISDDKLLSRIELLHDGAIYRKYVLGYEPGAGGNLRLNSIQDCVPGTPDDCLPATSIAWQSATSGHDAANAGPTVASGAIPLDIDGDGAEDLAWASGTWRYALGSPTGYEAAVNTGVSAVNPSKAMALDWNGDGLHDLLIDWSDGKWRVLKGSKSGLATTAVGAGPGGISSSTAGLSLTVSDVNGDGVDDLLSMPLNSTLEINVRYSNAIDGFGPLTTMFSDPLFHTQSKGFIQPTGASSVRRPDFNGDSRFDLLVYACFWDSEPPTGPACISSYRWYQMMSDGASFTWEGAIPGATYNIDVRFGDFNADGLTDIVYPQATIWTLGLGQGSGGFAIVNGPSNTAHATYQTVVGDYDGDGYDDLYVTESSSWTWKVFRSTGTALATTVTSPSPAISASNIGWMMTDQDGDSLPDLGSYNGSTFAWTMYSHKGLPGERFTTATDGLGSKVTFAYLPMSDAAVYDQNPTTPAFPDQFFVSAQPLVHTMQVQPAGDASGDFSLTYFYKEARRHGQGRQFLGMGWREFTDDRDGSQVIETYKQAFPVVGALESLRLYQSADGTKAYHATYQYSHHQLEVDPGNERFLPYLLSSNRKTYEVNVGGAKDGLLISEVSESRTVNTFGNLTTQTTTAYDRDSGSSEFGFSYQTQVTSTYKEATGQWCINVPTSRSETRTLPDFSSETRSITWTVNATRCRVTKEAIEPTGSSDEALVTDLGYDACGNVNSISVYPADLSEPTRTTSIDHGTRCQRPEVITNPETHKTRIAYRWDLALPTAHTDPNEFDDTTSPKSTIFEYDGFGRLTRQKRIDNTAARFAIAACGTAGNWCGTGSTAARLEITRTERNTSNAVLRTDTEILDGLGRVRWSKNDSLESGPAWVATVYDKLDRPVGRTQPYFTGNTAYSTVYEYDLLGRLTKIDAPFDASNASGRLTQFTYEGRDLKVTDARGMTSTRTGNVLGQLRALDEPSTGGTTNYAYKPFGEIGSITDAAGNVTSWSYNTRGFVDGTSDPDSGNWTYQVNAFGETKNIRDANTTSGWTTTFTYDKLSRLKTRFDVPEGVTTTFTWGAASHNSDAAKYIGRLKSVSMSHGNYSETYTADAYARLTKLRTAIEGSNWDVDLAYVSATGLLDTIRYPSGNGFRLWIQNQYQNNILKRVKEYQGTTTYWEAVTTDAWGHYEHETFGNGISVVAEFDQANGLMMRRYGGTGGASNRIDADLDWDPNDNFEKRIDHRLGSITEVFEYDTINRLDRSTLGVSQNLNVDYDPDGIGNIQIKDGLAYTYTRNATGCTYNFPHLQPRAVHKIGSTKYCYDANGNMTKRGGSSVTYSSYNLPTVINSGSNSSALSYGAFRNRYKQVAVSGSGTETTTYVAGLFERVTPSTGPTEYRNYIPGGTGIAAIHTRRSNGTNDTFYVHNDHLGSPELFTRSDGTELLRVSFGAYGERRDGTDWSGPPSAADLAAIAGITRRGFTGHEHLDAVGLIHMNGRVFDPVAGRFLGADPIVEIGSSQAPNSYAYVWNNPLTMIDPSGFAGQDVTETGTEPETPVFPDWPYGCPFGFGWRCDGFDPWYFNAIFEYQVERWVRARIYQAYLGNQQPGRVPVLAMFTAADARAVVERIQDALVDRNCGVICGIGYAGTQAIYEGLIEDALISIDQARAGNYDQAIVAAILATVKPIKFLKRAGIWRSSRIDAAKMEHIFSADHVRKGIMDLGTSRVEILSRARDSLMAADRSGALREGMNTVVTRINGHDATVKAFIKNGEMQSMDIFKGVSKRAGDNVIDLR